MACFGPYRSSCLWRKAKLPHPTCGLIGGHFGESRWPLVYYIKQGLAAAAMASVRPLIGIPADRRMVGQHPFHMVGEKYARAVMEAAGAAPLLIPSLA